MSEVQDSLWVEKYRPKKLKDVVLPEQYKKDFERIIEKQQLPNLIFYGPPGGGKTTLARILCSKNGVLFNRNDNMLMANGSSRKTRGIGFVDNVIEPFLKYPPRADKYKVVFIDEADKLTNDGYDSLRGIIEKYQTGYGRFLFTCNYYSKIPEAVQSRFTPYHFKQIPREFIIEYCQNILNTEGVEFKEKDIAFTVNQLYPDIRRIVNIIQRCSWEGKLKIDEETVTTNEKKITSYIVEIIGFIEKNKMNMVGSNVNSIVEIVSQNELEYRDIYSTLFFMEKIPAPAKIIVNKYSNEHQNCLIPHMHFMGMVFEIIKSLRDFMLSREVK